MFYGNSRVSVCLQSNDKITIQELVHKAHSSHNISVLVFLTHIL